MSATQVTLIVAATPIAAALIGAIVIFSRKRNALRDARARVSSSALEIDRILLDARIREAKAREAPQ